MNPTLLAAIVTASMANASPQSPHGYCFRNPSEQADIQALVNGGMVEAAAANQNGIPVRPTDAAIKWHAEAQQQPHHTGGQQQTGQQHVPQHAAVSIDDGVPMPETKRAGFAPREGGSLIDQYGFDKMQIGQSFFVAQSASNDPKKPVHRTFSSVVSQANKKLHPKNYAIREVDETAQGRGKGARVWRVQDMVGERPTRTRKKADAPAPQGQHMPAAPGAPAGTAPIPGVDNFGPQGGFGGGFAPQPQQGFGQAPQFGGGFDAPQGFGGPAPFGGGPSFDG